MIGEWPCALLMVLMYVLGRSHDRGTTWLAKKIDKWTGYDRKM